MYDVYDDRYFRYLDKYRKRYPQDYYLDDEDILQEIWLKTHKNKSNNVNISKRIGLYLEHIHRKYEKQVLNDNVNLNKESYDIENAIDIIGTRLCLDEIQNKPNSYLFRWLTQREWKVMLLRFGFIDGCVWTLEEVAEEFEVTRERIRQIEGKALRKLRQPNKSKHLERLFFDIKSKNKTK